MRLLLVTFALRNAQRDYEPFFVALRGNVLQWWHFILQTCVVATHHSAQELADLIRPHIDLTTDYLLITEIKPHEFQGWLPAEAWTWLTQVSDAIAPRNAPAPGLTPPPRRLGS